MKGVPTYSIQFQYDGDDNLWVAVYWGIQEQRLIDEAHAYTKWGALRKAKRIIRRHKRLAKRGIFLRG